MALWRTNGYAKTTVADICRAAGVSRALFYFYFPAKEDVLFEVGLLSTRSAQKTMHGLLTADYDIHAVIRKALRSLERSMGRNPRGLVGSAAGWKKTIAPAAGWFLTNTAPLTGYTGREPGMRAHPAMSTTAAAAYSSAEVTDTIINILRLSSSGNRRINVPSSPSR